MSELFLSRWRDFGKLSNKSFVQTKRKLLLVKVNKYMDYFWVAFGGGLGATLRLFVSQQFIFPVGTMLVNVLGSFAMGYAFVYLNDRLLYPMGLFVMTDFPRRARARRNGSQFP